MRNQAVLLERSVGLGMLLELVQGIGGAAQGIRHDGQVRGLDVDEELFNFCALLVQAVCYRKPGVCWCLDARRLRGEWRDKGEVVRNELVRSRVRSSVEEKSRKHVQADGLPCLPSRPHGAKTTLGSF